MQVVTYFFYKNLTFTLTQFWFTFRTGFSGQRFYDDWFQSLYNVIFTALPVIVLGLFEKVPLNPFDRWHRHYCDCCFPSAWYKLFLSLQDVSATLSKKYPELYKEGIRNTYFKWRVIAVWAFFAIYQSLVLYYFVTASTTKGMNSAGKMLGLWDVSTMAFTCVVVTVNLRLLMMCNTITKWHQISVGGSILLWFIFIFIYSGIVLPKNQVSFLPVMIAFLYLKLPVLTCSVFLWSTEEHLFCHLCLDEHILFLCRTASCAYRCTLWWLLIPGVRFRD